MTRSIGVLLLAAFLLVFGVLLITNIEVQFASFIEGILAIAAAVFLAWGK